MTKLFHTLVKTNNTHNSSIRSDKGLTLETSAFQFFHGGNSILSKKYRTPELTQKRLSSTQKPKPGLIKVEIKDLNTCSF